MRVLLGITGASGAVYGVRTGALLVASGAETSVIVSPTAWGILSTELGGPPIPASPDGRRDWLAARMGCAPGAYRLCAEDDFGIPFVSGSNPPDAMILAPCSMGTVGRIAHGTSDSVLTRCADVALKERRPLVVVARETPLSSIHLENLLTLSRAGADILPACPGFYHRPSTVDDLVDFVVARVLARVGIEAALHERWGEAGEAR